MDRIASGPAEVDPGAAETAWQEGDWSGALDHYLRHLDCWLLHHDADAPLPQPVLVALERTADLAVPFRELAGADQLLAALAAAQQKAGRRLAADYVSLKRVHLALEAGRLDD